MGGLPGVLIAPTEPASLKELGMVSAVPEAWGGDVLWGSPVLGLVVVQRKEIKDLIASMSDGRLGKEIVQLSRVEGVRVLVIEGRAKWTVEGELMHDHARVSLKQVMGVCWSAGLKGIWVERTESLQDTIRLLRWLHAWSLKPKHEALNRMPGVKGDGWGRVTNRDYAKHLLTAFPGVGGELADRIIEHFGGVPLRWEVGVEELCEVPGIGKVRAERLMKALEVER